MTGPDSLRRAYSSRVLSLIATIVSVYALGLYLSISPVVGRMTSSGSVICGDPARTFATPGRMGWPHGLHPQDSTGRLIHMRHDRFPYSAGQRPPYLRDEFQFVALGLRPGDPGWTHVPRVDGHPLWVKRSLFIDDKLLVWGAYQVSPGTEPKISSPVPPSKAPVSAGSYHSPAWKAWKTPSVAPATVTGLKAT